MARLAALAAALALAACSSREPPWLTMPTTDQHSSRWFPTAGGAHAECTCEDCHGPSPTFAGVSFTEYDCLHCHTGEHASEADLAAVHVAVADFAFTSAACYRCHPDGVAVDHAPIFPIAAGAAHEATACRECHVDPANRAVLGCAGCHPHERATTDAQHAGVGGYQWVSALCVRCHADAQVNAIAAHLPFRIQPGSTHSGTGDGDCLRCHPALRADKPFGANFSIAECLGCHGRTETDDRHRGESGYAYESAACLRCHPSGRGD